MIKDNNEINKTKMESIYGEIKTPFKQGAVIKLNDYYSDSPSVFRYNGKWYMYYVLISKNTDKSGYETHLSSSDDLLNWKYEGAILKRNSDKKSWDSHQCGGYAAFIDMNFGATNEIQKVNNKYYLAYLGGAGNGYEPDPLYMGLAYSNSPIDSNGFKRFPKPVISPFDKDASEFERKTIYKGNMLIDNNETLGCKYINFYNAKSAENKERIYVAGSNDGENWKRLFNKPLIDETQTIDNLLISGDPQVVKIGEVYVMFYYRYIKNTPAYNTFAVSRNLRDWEIWDGEPLIKSEYEWENIHAHKSCVLSYNGVVYHFYCAVNDKNERFVALATSKK